MSQSVIWSIIATLLAVVGAGIGINLGSVVRHKLELLVHIATGALLGITAFDILPEAKAVLNWPVFLIASLGGYALLWGVGTFVFYVCPSCAIAHAEDSSNRARNGSLILLASALGIHCLLDGLAIGTGGHLSVTAETGALIGVALHKLPEGLALGVLLLSARYDKMKSLGIAVGIEALTIAGAFGASLFAAIPGRSSVGIVFAVVGGGFIYLVWNALGGAFSHQAEMPRARSLATQAFSFILTGALFWIAARS